MILRIARHTNRIEELKVFYTEIIGLKILGEFKNHDGYDGAFIGREDLNWHLEFTTSSDKASQKIDDDDLIVFYPESKSEFESIAEKIKTKQIRVVNAKNSYWNQNGILIKDPDGFGVIISALKTKK
jgi:catechol-2,3-dioxygenase